MGCDRSLELLKDPVEGSMALTEPWINTKTFRKLPEGTRVFDYGCAGAQSSGPGRF
jgi:hypothetical protein